MDEIEMLSNSLKALVVEQNMVRRAKLVQNCLTYLKVHLTEDQKLLADHLQSISNVILGIEKLQNHGKI